MLVQARHLLPLFDSTSAKAAALLFGAFLVNYSYSTLKPRN